MRDVLVIGLAIAVVLILIKVIWGSPLVARVREGFAGSALINTMTECPPGSQMYMYEGQAYCCSTNINPDADSIQQTCKEPVPVRGGPPFIFCTLGPSTKNVQNCLELRAGYMQAEGEKQCPANLPYYVKGPVGTVTSNGRCCAGPGNQQFTDCADPTQLYCNVTNVPDFLKEPTSCQFLRLQQNTTCPSGYNKTTIMVATKDDTFVACSDGGKVCYPESMLSLIKERGDTITGYQPCATLQS